MKSSHSVRHLLFSLSFVCLLVAGPLPAADIPDIDSSQPSVGERLSSENAVQVPAIEKSQPQATPREKPRATPRPSQPKPRTTPRPKARSTPRPTPPPATTGAATVGKNFVNTDGMTMEFRKADRHDRPFWRSVQPFLSSDPNIAAEYCRRLTEKEAALGYLPANYAYLPSLANDGKMVLAYTTTTVTTTVNGAVTNVVTHQGPLPASAPVSTVPRAEAVSVPAAQPVSASMPREKADFVNGAGMRMTWRQMKTMGYWFYEAPITPDLFDRIMGDSRIQWPGDIGRAGAIIAGKLDPQERAAGRVPAGWGYRMRNQSEICLLPLN